MARSSPTLEPITRCPCLVPGWAEQDADAIWWADVCAIARRLAAAVPPGDRIAAVALSAIGPTLLPLDDAGRPLRSGILYGVDTRATAQIAALEARHGTAALAGLSGHGLSSQAVGPKIVWLREEEPEIAARARWYRDGDDVPRLPADRCARHRCAHGVALEPALRSASDRLE